MADVQEKHRRETSKMFVPAMKPLQPRNAKKYLVAVIVAQAMNQGHHVMDTTYEQYLRLASLLTANNCITDAIEALPVFPLYLCTYTTTNPTRQAIFEYDLLVRSIYTLKYMRDPQLERNIRRSQNRVESYHQLRAAVSKVGGKKELSRKNDLETEISNQCGRLISNAIVYYNSAILLRLLERLEAEDNAKGIEALTRISPVAWQHILFNWHYTFHSSNEIMDLDALVAGLKLG